MPGRANSVGLPPRPFLFTIDQIATMLSVAESTVRMKYVYYWGRSTGSRPRDKMMARNIAPDGEKPEWRILDRELVRFLRVKGFRMYEQDWSYE
jgi:hypothetical protein